MKNFMKKYWFLGVVLVILVPGVCWCISSSKVNEDRLALLSEFHSIERADLELTHAKNWDKDVDWNLSEEEIEKLVFLLKNLPSESLQVGDGAVDTGHLSLYFMTKEKEEFVLKYDKERIYITLSSEGAEKYGKRNWEIRNSQFVDYCLELLFSK